MAAGFCDRSANSTSSSPVALPVLGPALASAAIVLIGLILMQRDTPFPGLPTLPTGILGNIFGNAQSVIYGTLCALLGCAGIFRFLPAYLGDDSAVTFPDSSTGHQGSPRFLPSGVAGVIGVLLYGAALAGAVTHSTIVVLPLFLAGGVAVFYLLIRWWIDGGRDIVAMPWPPYEVLFVLVVVVAFIILNLQDLTNWLYAYIGDEWAFYDAAGEIVHGVPVDPFTQAGVYGIHPMLDSLYQALCMLVFGVNVVGWRMSSIVAAALPAAILYWGARQIGGTAYACASMAFYSSCLLLWAFAHIGYNNNDALLPMVAAGALCYRGLQRQSVSLLFASGVAAGAGWYTIYTGRLMVAVLGLLLLTECTDGLRATARRLGFFAAGFVVTVVPLLLDNGSSTFSLMSHNSVFSTLHDSGAIEQSITQNLVRGLYEFLYSVAHDHYVTGAIFDVIAATALCIGISLAVRHPRRISSRLLLIWFVVTSALTTPLSDSPQVSLTRSMVIVPPAAMLAASGLCAIALAVQGLMASGKHFAFRLVVGALLAITLAINMYEFYVVMPDQQYPPFPKLVLMIKTILVSPHTLIVLPADMQAQDGSGTFCDALNGYQIDVALLVYPVSARLIPYCDSSDHALMPQATVLIFQDSPTASARCSVPPSAVLVAKQGTIWAFKASLPEPISANYNARVLLAVSTVCPQIY